MSDEQQAAERQTGELTADETSIDEPHGSEPRCAEAPADIGELKRVVEAILLAAGRPLSLDQLLALFTDEERPQRDDLRSALASLADDYAGRGIELAEVGSGYRVQIRQEMQPWVSRLWEEKPARYSRALLETLALIAYRQPITRGDIEDVRGVTVSTSIMKTLLEREWIRVVGHREVPGRPAMYGTTKQFLDYFSLKNLEELPTLAELRDLGSFSPELQLDLPDSVVDSRLMPANDEPDTPLHAQEEDATTGESAEDASASYH
ncbi:MAG: SMC-Scp complex subunit ScpB [Gammaproteobacteria bacterium]